MKSARLFRSLSLVGCAIALNCIGCGAGKGISTYAADQSGHRLVRVSFSGQRGNFRIRINDGPLEKVRNSYFTNIMTKFNFEYGAIVVWEAVRDERGKELTWPDDLLMVDHVPGPGARIPLLH